MNLLDELQEHVICGDGAMGTLLLDQGLPMLLLDGVILPGHDRCDISRHHSAGREAPYPTRVVRARCVRHHHPAVRRFDRERKGRLEVWLVEARVTEVCEVLRELAVQVGASV